MVVRTMEPALGRRRPTRSSSKSYTDTHTDSLGYDIITHTLDPIQDRTHIQPVRKLSVWRAVLKERYCRTPGKHIRCIWRDQNKQRQPCTTIVNDSLDDCYNDAPEDILLSIIQIDTDTTQQNFSPLHCITHGHHHAPRPCLLQMGESRV